MNKETLALIHLIVANKIAAIKIPEGVAGPRGFAGRNGNDFNIQDHEDTLKSFIKEHAKVELSDEQLESLRGKNGRDGNSVNLEDVIDTIRELAEKEVSKISDSLKLKFSDLTDEEKLELQGRKGDRGEKGQSFDLETYRDEISQIIKESVSEISEELKLKYSDLSEEEKEEIKGKKGDKGDRGRDGESFDFDTCREEILNNLFNYILEIKKDLALKFSDLTEDEKLEIKGSKGDRGERGRDGISFSYEENREAILSDLSKVVDQESDKLKLKFEDLTEEDREKLSLKFDDLTPEQKKSLRGKRGQVGKTGLSGEDGKDGNAFHFLENFEGTAKEGDFGVDSKGDFYAFLKNSWEYKTTLKGSDGINGLHGLDGINGVNGVNGINGVDGKDAPHVVKVEVLPHPWNKEEMYMVFKYSDGSQIATNYFEFPEIRVNHVHTSYSYTDSASTSSELEVAYEGNSLGKPQKLNFTGHGVEVLDKGSGVLDIHITSDSSLLRDVYCDASVYLGSFVYIDEDEVAQNALADKYETSNVIGLVETINNLNDKCNIRVTGISAELFLGLDPEKEYYLSDTDAGRLTDVVPTTSGSVKIRLGQSFGTKKFVFQKGERLVRL